MTRRKLLAALDAGRVEEAIRAAERAAAIELRVSVAGPFWGSVQRVAERAFLRLGMTATRRRSGILLFIAPWRRRVVVVADQGITAKVDPSLWTDLVAALTQAFRERRFTEGVVGAITGLGGALAPHFPVDASDVNELSNALDPRG